MGAKGIRWQLLTGWDKVLAGNCWQGGGKGIRWQPDGCIFIQEFKFNIPKELQLTRNSHLVVLFRLLQVINITTHEHLRGV